MALLQNHLQKKGYGDLKVEDLGGLEPAKTSYREPLVTIAAEAAKQVFSKEPVIDPISEASGPLYLFRNKLKIPFIGIGVAHSFSGTHSPNENILVKDFIDTIKWIGAMFSRMNLDVQ